MSRSSGKMERSMKWSGVVSCNVFFPFSTLVSWSLLLCCSAQSKWSIQLFAMCQVFLHRVLCNLLCSALPSSLILLVHDEWHLKYWPPAPWWCIHKHNDVSGGSHRYRILSSNVSWASHNNYTQALLHVIDHSICLLHGCFWVNCFHNMFKGLGSVRLKACKHI